MTGRRPTTSGCYGNGDVWRDAMPLAVTLPQHFMQHSYEAIGGGKTFHNTQNEAASWHYYNSFRGFLWAPGWPVNELDRSNFDWSSLDVDDEETSDTQLADWAARYLSNQWRKYTLWERSCRVPIIFAGPGVEAKGGFCDRTAELLEIYPTLADLAGLPEREEQRLRAMLPQNPSRKKTLQVFDQPEEERRLTELLSGRSDRAGAANDVGLDPAPP